MALVKKGSRTIVVDGVTYRWRLRKRPTYSQGLVWSPCTFAVEHVDGSGRTLVVRTNRPHAGNWAGGTPEAVVPSVVAGAIQLALRRGWKPTRPGSPFLLDLSEGLTSSA